jgi:hypothetical protein
VRQHDLSKHAGDYLSGLLGINIRKNVGRIDEGLPDANYQGKQQFISDSPWDPNGLMAQALRQEFRSLTVRDVVELLEIYLPRRDRTEAEIWAAMRRRHEARQRAIDSAHRK